MRTVQEIVNDARIGADAAAVELLDSASVVAATEQVGEPAMARIRLYLSAARTMALLAIAQRLDR